MDNGERDKRISDLNARIAAHPGAREHATLSALAKMVNSVFIPNWRELRVLLDTPSRDMNLAVELFQNVRRPDAREGYEGAVGRQLHNYVASAMTVVAHARRTMHGRTGEIADEYVTRYKAVAVEPESAFIQGLRNFTLHHALPFVGHTVHISDPGTTPSATVDIQLSSEDLLSGDRWNATARTFIMRGNAVSLTPVIEVHGLLIVELHHWLLRALADANEPALGEVNELIVERTAALLDADTERARMITARWTAARQSPEPPADFEALLGNPRKQDEAA